MWLASRGALNIRVLIGGTLRKPTLSLESDAQPPRTQSELVSLLAFGQSSTGCWPTDRRASRARRRHRTCLVRRDRSRHDGSPVWRSAWRPISSSWKPAVPSEPTCSTSRPADVPIRKHRGQLVHADEVRGGEVRQSANLCDGTDTGIAARRSASSIARQTDGSSTPA